MEADFTSALNAGKFNGFCVSCCDWVQCCEAGCEVENEMLFYGMVFN